MSFYDTGEEIGETGQRGLKRQTDIVEMYPYVKEPQDISEPLGAKRGGETGASEGSLPALDTATHAGVCSCGRIYGTQSCILTVIQDSEEDCPSAV